VTLLHEDRILPGLDELFAALGADLPSALAIVTDPSPAPTSSRSSSSASTPGEVHVVLLPPGSASRSSRARRRCAGKAKH